MMGISTEDKYLIKPVRENKKHVRETCSRKALENLLHLSVFRRSRGIPYPKFNNLGVVAPQGPACQCAKFHPLW